MSMQETPWHKADKGKVHTLVIQHIERVERNQSDIFDRFVKLAALYDPNSDESDERERTEKLGGVSENVVASNVDTVTAAVAATDVRARFQTDDADWSVQRRARQMELYAEEMATLLDVMPKCVEGFKWSSVKGTGVNKVYNDRWGRIQVEPVPIDNIIVDETEVRNGRLRQIHQRTPNVHMEDLIAEHPEKEEQIEAACKRGSSSRMWAGYRPIDPDTMVVCESWKLPIGVKGERGYKAGRYTKVVEGLDLVDEPWHDECHPFATLKWSKKGKGFYGISGVERIAGHQKIINKSNFQIDKLIDQYAMPTTYVRQADANLAVKSINRLGTIAVVKGEYPKTIHPPAVSPEVYNRRAVTKDSAFEEFGVSRLAAQSTKPAGLDSGIALREYRDQTTQRFSLQEKAFEKFVLETITLVLWCAKKLGKKAPVVSRKTKFGARKIKWSDVDMGDVKVQIAAASTLARTPAGRMQAVIEWAQAGVISQDEARRLLRHPDLEGAMSLYTAALENVEHALEEIEDGRVVMPEPFMNLKMCVWRGQMRYLEDRDKGAPEHILEGIRQFVVQAAWMTKQMMAAPANANAPVGAGAADPMADPMAATGGMPDPAMASDPSMGVAAGAAFAPQAMQLRAG